MEEGIGNGGGVPDKRHRTLYKRWAEGGWGMIITGMSGVLLTLHTKILTSPLLLQVMSKSTLVIWPRHTTVPFPTTPHRPLPPTPSSVPPSFPLPRPPRPAQ
jgi:hypothetical protein